MERRQAVTAAAAASVTFLLGAAGLTANAAILGSHPDGGVGRISPIAATVAVPDGASGTADISTTTLKPVAPATTVPAVAPAAPVTAPAHADSSDTSNDPSDDSADEADDSADDPDPVVVPTTAPPQTSPPTTVNPSDDHEIDDDSAEVEEPDDGSSHDRPAGSIDDD